MARGDAKVSDFEYSLLDLSYEVPSVLLSDSDKGD